MAHSAYIKSGKTLGRQAAAIALLTMPAMVLAQTEATLPTTKVSAPEQTTPAIKKEKSASPKLTQPLVDTPQTVTVISKEVLQQQGAVSLMQALQNTPGITMQLGEGGATNAGDTFSMRGFRSETSTFVDGVRDLGAVSRDTFNLEQVEIVKGPSGADIGRGATSGYINLISKSANLEDNISGSVGASTADNQRFTLDANKVIDDTTAVRVNLLRQQGSVAGRDKVEKNTDGVAVSLATGLGTNTVFTLNAQHIKQDNVPDGGVPTIGLEGYYNSGLPAGVTASPVNSSNYYGLNGDYEDVTADMITGKLEHTFANGNKLTNITRFGKSDTDRIMTAITASTTTSTNAAAWTSTRSRQYTLQDNTILANQTNLQSQFKTGSIEHDLLVGMELLHEGQNSYTRSGLGTVAAANAYNPNSGDTLTGYAPYLTGASTKGFTNTIAVYGFDTLKLNEQWQLSGGLRLEHYNTQTDVTTVSGSNLIASNLEKSGNLLGGKLGLVYKPAANGSVYLAYATSQKPAGSDNFTLSTSATSSSNTALDPQKTENIELGTKWDLLDNKLGLTAAIYQTTNKNELAKADSVTGAIVQYGKREVKGMELGLVGQITPAWQVTAGVAHMKTDITEGSTTSTAGLTGQSADWSPEWSATLWSSYKVNNDLTIGGGVRYMGKNTNTKVRTTEYIPGIPAYTVVDAMASYKLNKNVNLQLNVYNLFDEDYIASLNNNRTRYVPGTPRTANLTANFTF
ncbi:MAG: catecholate siderophore receptor Fiu [Vogesella sp.]|uniref:catecholate siderophore receptor Fiu n=1 Tax=Vogesella sp. TaxID=1904252 RepID=UPI00391D3203